MGEGQIRAISSRWRGIVHVTASHLLAAVLLQFGQVTAACPIQSSKNLRRGHLSNQVEQEKIFTIFLKPNSEFHRANPRTRYRLRNTYSLPWLATAYCS